MMVSPSNVDLILYDRPPSNLLPTFSMQVMTTWWNINNKDHLTIDAINSLIDGSSWDVGSHATRVNLVSPTPAMPLAHISDFQPPFL